MPQKRITETEAQCALPGFQFFSIISLGEIFSQKKGNGGWNCPHAGFATVAPDFFEISVMGWRSSSQLINLELAVILI